MYICGMSKAEIIARQNKEIQSLREENRLLRLKVDALVRRVFGGGQSEKLSSNQLEMFGDEPSGQSKACVDKAAATQAMKKPRQHKLRRPRYPEHLPVVEEILDPEGRSKRIRHITVKLAQRSVSSLTMTPVAFSCVNKSAGPGSSAKLQMPCPSRLHCRQSFLIVVFWLQAFWLIL